MSQTQASKIKVLHVEAGKYLYGGAQQVVYLLQELAHYPVESVLACPTGSDIAGAASEFAKVVEMDMKGDLDIGLAFRLKRVIEQENIDVLHLHSRRGADIWGALAAKLTGCKVLLTRRVDNAEAPWFAKMKYAWFDKVAAISEGIRQVLLQQGVPAEHVTTVRSAVDLSLFKPNAAPAWFEQEFGYSQDHFVIGVVAQLIERKGHQLLFDVLPKLTEQFPNLRVEIFGKGPLRESLQQQIKDKQLDNIVHFAGFRTDMVKVLPNLNLVVHPAYIEGLGVSLLQAAACGVPVVSCKTGGIPEAVADNEHGLLVEPGDSQGIGQAIETLIEQPELLAQFKARGIARMNQSFALDVMAAGNVALYQDLTGVDLPCAND